MKSDKKRQKLKGMKYRIREEKKREERIGSAMLISILVAIISASGLIINTVLNQPSTSQPVTSTVEPKAAVVDQLSLTYPNQSFVETATNTLKQAGYAVDYYSGQQVTVEFFRNLPTRGYGMIILRVHSAAAAFEGKEFAEAPVSFFTSENYSRTKYVWEQLTDQLVVASYTMPQPPYYFGITPKFVTSSMNGKFQNTAVVMMGCEGLNNTNMAEAFIEKGAEVYISWNKSVLASRTDHATARLLEHLITEKQTIENAVTTAMKDVGADPVYNSSLIYYPHQVGSYAIPKTSSNLDTGAIVIRP